MSKLLNENDIKDLINDSLLEHDLINQEIYLKCGKPKVVQTLPYDLRTNDKVKLQERVDAIDKELRDRDTRRLDLEDDARDLRNRHRNLSNTLVSNIKDSVKSKEFLEKSTVRNVTPATINDYETFKNKWSKAKVGKYLSGYQKRLGKVFEFLDVKSFDDGSYQPALYGWVNDFINQDNYGKSENFSVVKYSDDYFKAVSDLYDFTEKILDKQQGRYNNQLPVTMQDYNSIERLYKKGLDILVGVKGVDGIKGKLSNIDEELYEIGNDMDLLSEERKLVSQKLRG